MAEMCEHPDTCRISHFQISRTFVSRPRWVATRNMHWTHACTVAAPPFQRLRLGSSSLPSALALRAARLAWAPCSLRGAPPRRRARPQAPCRRSSTRTPWRARRGPCHKRLHHARAARRLHPAFAAGPAHDVSWAGGLVFSSLRLGSLRRSSSSSPSGQEVIFRGIGRWPHSAKSIFW